ncbi:MAG: DUF4346 domain-containing protein [bacterium]
MTNAEALNKVIVEIKRGMNLPKCRKCGCMKDMLNNLLYGLLAVKTDEARSLLAELKEWLRETAPTEYACLGCKHCFPAVATNIITAELPAIRMSSSNCEFEAHMGRWPSVAAEYFVLCEDNPVAVTTLGSANLAEKLGIMKPDGLCIVGKTETENIGIDKVIKNIITNKNIRFLIISGPEVKGHYSGITLFSLYENGVDENMKIIGSPGPRPILKNVTSDEVKAFTSQVEVIKMIGCEDVEVITGKISELAKRTGNPCACKECNEPEIISTVPPPTVILAKYPKRLVLDKAGYFVIIPLKEKRTIIVEHYAYDNMQLHTIQGEDAPAIYSTIIENGWVSELSHAAYLGRELAKAELSMEHGFKFIQDGAKGESDAPQNQERPVLVKKPILRKKHKY